jgi:hypothetical protein
MGTNKYENSESFEEMARTQEQEIIPESTPETVPTEEGDDTDAKSAEVVADNTEISNTENNGL